MRRRDDEHEPVSVTSEAGYAAWAEAYDGHDNPMTAMVDHVLATAAPDVRGARVLELGCGTARNAVALSARGASRYLGIDNSPEMLAVAADRVAPLAGAEVIERDLRGAWWSDLGTFDLALISLVLEHHEQPAPILAGLGEVVADGGLAWILELHPGLHAGGVRAHVSDGDRTLALPSFGHDAAELAAGFGAGWEPASATDWYATTELAGRSAKLLRYLGRPVLLDLRARRRPIK